MSVVMGRDGGDLDRTRRLGLRRCEIAVRKEIPAGTGRSRACGSSAGYSRLWAIPRG